MKTLKIDDLAAAIERGEMAGCGLDVFEVEPLPSTHRLWTLPNILLTVPAGVLADRDAGRWLFCVALHRTLPPVD